jgi:hypothetical protein
MEIKYKRIASWMKFWDMHTAVNWKNSLARNEKLWKAPWLCLLFRIRNPRPLGVYSLLLVDIARPSCYTRTG